MGSTRKQIWRGIALMLPLATTLALPALSETYTISCRDRVDVFAQQKRMDFTFDHEGAPTRLFDAPVTGSYQTYGITKCEWGGDGELYLQCHEVVEPLGISIEIEHRLHKDGKYTSVTSCVPSASTMSSGSDRAKSAALFLCASSDKADELSCARDQTFIVMKKLAEHAGDQ